MPVVVSIPASKADEVKPAKPAHHTPAGHFVNPWSSFVDNPMTFGTALNVYRDWKSKPVPPPEQLPQVITPNWGHAVEPTEGHMSAWNKDIKATWLGHACFLVEFPPPAGSTGPGPRVLFDPVFTQRCSPVQFMGPARVTQPPFKLAELPQVDAVVLSHNHYDHADVTTLKHIYAAQDKGTVHFFAPLGNAKWFESIGFAPEHVTEMDWWEERDLSVTLASGSELLPSHLRVTCTPCQHFTGRSINDRFHTLWASWSVAQLTSPTSTSAGRVWFGGDTGYKSVPRGAVTEEGLPTCPAFKEIGERLGPFDLACIPIGAYDPRWAMSRVHASPEDAVEIAIEVKSLKSVGMHWGTWILTSEEMTEPPKRLRSACEARGLTKEQFDVCDIGETIRATPAQRL